LSPALLSALPEPALAEAPAFDFELLGRPPACGCFFFRPAFFRCALGANIILMSPKPPSVRSFSVIVFLARTILLEGAWVPRVSGERQRESRLIRGTDAPG